MILVENRKTKEKYLFSNYEYSRIIKNKNLKIIKEHIVVPLQLQKFRGFRLNLDTIIAFEKKLIQKRKREIKIRKNLVKFIKKLKNGI